MKNKVLIVGVKSESYPRFAEHVIRLAMSMGFDPQGKCLELVGAMDKSEDETVESDMQTFFEVDEAVNLAVAYLNSKVVTRDTAWIIFSGSGTVHTLCLIKFEE